ITRTAEERAAVRPKSKLLQERHVPQSILRGSEEKGARQPLILSTIHSSKGLEYDTVYLLDVVDGIFPEDTPKSLKAMDKKERAAYEEERRLFYVGVTRAKNNLEVFKLDQKSSFCEELVRKETGAADKAGKISLQAKAKSRPVQAYASGGKVFSQEEYEKYAASLGEGLIVQHKKLGEGVVVEVQEDRVILQFSAGQKVFGLKTLYEYDLLVF
ncbi:MAG: ATP-dependent helicase, partial [Lachnospiraceae bacterium]|nr:ATP-dependent helicase [Lachnospiraceae bacterium]